MPAQIINSLNKLFSQIDSSLKLNEGGFFDGLANVIVRYYQKENQYKVLVEHQRKEQNSNSLEAIIGSYIRIRSKRAWTYYPFSLFQYTRQDKVDIADIFIAALKSPKIMINKRARAVLKNGSLGIQLEAYIKANALSLKQEINSPRELQTIDQVVDFLNRRSPVQALVEILKQYREQRAKDARRMYHYPMFPQFTKHDKLKAVDNFISQLETGSDKLSDFDIAALAQGSLGVALEDYIEEYGAELGDYFNVDEISNLGQLLNACTIQTTPVVAGK